MGLDWFQGLLVRAGVPFEALPVDGRSLSPADAYAVLSCLLVANVELRDFGPWRMATHLSWEAAQKGKALSRRELHERMRRFQGLFVLRPDGYLVRATTGEAVQYVGEVSLVDGALRSDDFVVGPFYAVRNRYLYAVDSSLGIHPDGVMAGVYAPDDGTVGPLLEGAGHAVLDTVEGIIGLILHPIDTIAGLAQLPEAVRALLENSPEYWEHFRALPHGAQVRAASRLITNVVIVFATAGSGASGAASIGSKLGRFSVPVLTLSADGALAVRAVVVSAGQVVTAVGAAPAAVYVLHMANMGARAGQVPGGAGGASGPGRWTTVKPSTSERARRYQEQITKQPASKVYRIDDVEYDGFIDDILLEAKGPGYRSFFDKAGRPMPWYRSSGKFDELMTQARNQSKMAERVRLKVRWHVAEEDVAEFLRRLFQGPGFSHVEVVHTPAFPR